jgi:predicted nucleic acid-binding protein
VTLYLDTSSLVKLYVDEPGRNDVLTLLEASDLVATSWLTYPECRAALARRRRERTLSARDFARAKQDFERDWPQYSAVRLTADLCRHAGELAERYRLRALDGLHLASYHQLAGNLGVRQVEFSGFDTALNRAAHSLRRTLLKRAD